MVIHAKNTEATLELCVTLPLYPVPPVDPSPLEGEMYKHAHVAWLALFEQVLEQTKLVLSPE